MYDKNCIHHFIKQLRYNSSLVDLCSPVTMVTMFVACNTVLAKN